MLTEIYTSQPKEQTNILASELHYIFFQREYKNVNTKTQSVIALQKLKPAVISDDFVGKVKSIIVSIIWR